MTLRVLLLTLALLDPVLQLDHAVRDAVQGARHPALEPTMRAATGVGRPVLLLGGLLALSLFGGPAGVPMARAVVVALVPVNLAVEGLKWAVARPRPDGDRNRRNSSFPSSHAANAAALAWLLWRRWPRGAVLYVLLAGLVAFSRMYLDRHFLSDVTAGVLLGVGLSWLVMRIAPGLDPRRLRVRARAVAAG